MSLYDLTEFLKLSSVLNYNLSAASLNRYNLLLFILGDKPLHPPTTLGDLGFERAYYYCPQCHQGVFPPGSGTAPDA